MSFVHIIDFYYSESRRPMSFYNFFTMKPNVIIRSIVLDEIKSLAQSSPIHICYKAQFIQ